MRTCKLMILVFAFALIFGNNAGADLYGVPPIGTCVPDSATIRAGHYETAGFGGSGHGLVVVPACPTRIVAGV
jgi:hypothetical protein